MEGTHRPSSFAMAGTPPFPGVTRAVARVPLSDYVVTASTHRQALGRSVMDLASGTTAMEMAQSGNVHTHLFEDPGMSARVTRIHTLASALFSAQARQTIPQHVDDRFRFRCILAWVQHGGSITTGAAQFVLGYGVKQWQLGKAEEEGLKLIVSDRWEVEGLGASDGQEQSLAGLEKEMGESVEFAQRVRELVGLVREGGQVDGEVDVRMLDEALLGMERAEAERHVIGDYWKMNESPG